MEAKPVSPELVAMTEKKMNMSLDDIINMSKTNENRGRKQRVWDGNRRFSNNGPQDRNAKVERVVNNRSFMRQSNQFPLATEAAKNSAAAPIHNRAFNQRRAMDVNKLRVAKPQSQKKAANEGGFMMKQSSRHQAKPAPVRQPQNFQHQAKPAPVRQKPRTLDSLFANMKEQRLKSFSQQYRGPRRNGGGHQSIVPWARNRFIR